MPLTQRLSIHQLNRPQSHSPAYILGQATFHVQPALYGFSVKQCNWVNVHIRASEKPESIVRQIPALLPMPLLLLSHSLLSILAVGHSLDLP